MNSLNPDLALDPRARYVVSPIESRRLKVLAKESPNLARADGMVFLL